MNVLAMCKFAHDDESEHLIVLRLTRPDGTETDVDFGKPIVFSLATLPPLKAPGVPRGANLIGPWGVKATNMGLHRLTLLVDGEESAYTFFTLAPLPDQSA